MTQEEIIKLAQEAGFENYAYEAVGIFERFARLVSAAEREKFTNTQEFVTLPREAVERALAALDAEDQYRAAIVLRAALEQPQNHIPDAGNMVPAGWKLVPVEPTEEMLRAGCGSESPAMFRESLTDKQIDAIAESMPGGLDGFLKGWGWRQFARAVLEAAPQPPALEQQVEQESTCKESLQVEQEPVAWIWTEWSNRKLTFDGPPAVPSVRDELTKPVWTPLYTRPQREPLTDEELDAVMFSVGLSCTAKDVARAIEAAHNIK